MVKRTIEAFFNLFHDELISENRWNFVQKFKESDEYKRLTTELGIEEDRVIITAGKIYDYLNKSSQKLDN